MKYSIPNGPRQFLTAILAAITNYTKPMYQINDSDAILMPQIAFDGFHVVERLAPGSIIALKRLLSAVKAEISDRIGVLSRAI